MGQWTLPVIAVVVVAAIAMFMRRRAGDESDAGAPTTGIEPMESVSGAPEPSPGSWLDDDDTDETVMAAITSDGWTFMPDEDEVQIVPLAAGEGGEETDPTDAMNASALFPHPRHRRLPITKPGEHLDAGDFVGARVVRGSPGADPWRLEALGHDGEYRSWAFETEEAARAALDLLVTRIVRVPVDDDGTPHPPGEAEYAAAVALTEAGVADLAMDTGDEPPETFTR